MTRTAPGEPALADRPLLGVMLMLGFCMLAPVSDATAKLLGGLVPLGLLILVRFGLQTLLLAPLLLRSGQSLVLPPRLLRLTAFRTVLHVVSMGLFFTALRYLPLADAVAISFVMPFILLLLGRVFLGEAVGPHRIAACGVGFLGTMLVIQPSFAAVGAPALLPLVVALLFALFMLVTRQIAREADPLLLQATSGAFATALLLPPILVGTALGWPELEAAVPGPGAAALLLLLGILGTLAHLLVTWSLRFAPSATLAPMQYLEIPFATLIGFLVFGDLPDGLAAVGIAVTVGAGLYVIHRERRSTLRAAAGLGV